MDMSRYVHATIQLLTREYCVCVFRSSSTSSRLDLTWRTKIQAEEVHNGCSGLFCGWCHIIAGAEGFLFYRVPNLSSAVLRTARTWKVSTLVIDHRHFEDLGVGDDVTPMDVDRVW